MVKDRPADTKPIATLITLRGVFGLWESNDYSNLYVTPGPLNSPEKPVITFEPMAVTPGVILADSRHYLRSMSRRHYRRGSVYFVGERARQAQQALAR